MSMVFMSRNQRELVKFLRFYCINPLPLIAKSEDKSNNSDDSDGEQDPLSALTQFDPDANQIDGLIYKNLVEAVPDLDRSISHSMNDVQVTFVGV